MTSTPSLRWLIVLSVLVFDVMNLEARAAEIAGVYTVSHGRDAARNMQGGSVSWTGYPTPWFGVVVEGGGQRTGSNCSDAQWGQRDAIERCDGSHALLTFALGPRVMLRHTHAIAPFVQLLRGSASGNNYGDFGLGAVSAWVWQPGVGADVRLRPNVGLRVAADYFKPEAAARFARLRFSVGVVFRRQ